MSYSWMPVAPDLNKGGAFISLSHLKKAKELKPLHLGANDENFTQFKVFQKQFSANAASELGIAPVGSGSGSFKSYVFMYEAMLFSDKITDTALGGMIYGTRWGAGLRVSLKVSEIKSDFKVGFGTIAASSEVGLSKVEFEISGIGITDASILKALPGPGDFNYDSYDKILKAAERVKRFMADNHEKLSPKPFQILITDASLSSNLDKSKSVLYAVKSIEKKISLADALSNSPQLNSDIIEGVYHEFEIKNVNTKPSNEDRREAREWLNEIF